MPGKSRIFKNLTEIVNPEHTVVVIWDVQNGLVNAIFNKNEFIAAARNWLKVTRETRVPVVYTKITPIPKPFESPFRTYMMMKNAGVDDPAKLPPFMAPGSPMAEIHSEVAPLDGEVVLNKHVGSIFIGTYFEYLLKNRGIQTVIFSGINTEVGIDSSARDAVNRGYYTIVAEDCVSSSNKELHDAALKTLRKICLVLPSKDIIQTWK